MPTFFECLGAGEVQMRFIKAAGHPGFSEDILSPWGSLKPRAGTDTRRGSDLHGDRALEPLAMQPLMQGEDEGSPSVGIMWVEQCHKPPLIHPKKI